MPKTSDSVSRGALPPGQRGPVGNPQDTDAEVRLVAALQAGDQDAFEEMVRSHGARLLAVARRLLRNEEDARDCVQEAFLSAHRRIGTFEGRSTLRTWLQRIVTNAALTKLRAKRSRPEEVADSVLPTYEANGLREGPSATNVATPEELLQRSGTAAMVREALDRLPDSYRTIILLRDIQGYTTQETAETLEISDGAVKVRLHRARTALRTLIQPLFEEDA